MTVRAGSRFDATDFTLPDPARGAGSGTNSITATSWAVLPSSTCTATVENPHPSASMLCIVTYGAWLVATASDVRVSVDISGALTIGPGIGAGGIQGWGEILLSAIATAGQYSATFDVEVPPGTTVFKQYAYRTAATGSQSVNYPTLRVIPVRFLF